MATEVTIEPNPINFGYNNVISDPYPAFDAGDKVLLMDDLLATGGTAAASTGLIEQAGLEDNVELLGWVGQDRLQARRYDPARKVRS